MKLAHFGTDGIRGVVGSGFDAGYIFNIASAAARWLCGHNTHDVVYNDKHNTPYVVVGWDTRASCDFIADIFCGVLAGAGIHVLKVGVVPTAALSYLTAKFGAQMGIMVSASHNNYTYNGIKFFGPGGAKLSEDATRGLDALLTENQRRKTKNECAVHTTAERVGRVKTDLKAIKHWERFLIKQFKKLSAATTRTRVVIDAANGSGAECARRVLTALGYDVVLYNTAPDGFNINKGCGATVPDFLADIIKRENGKASKHSASDRSLPTKRLPLAAGFAFDGDADRCVVFDERGEAVHGDVLIWFLAKHLKSKGQLRGNKIAATVLFNLGVERALLSEGIGLIRTDVGDRFVYRAIKEQGLSLGGESSGHVIFPEIWTSGDGLLTALAALRALQETKDERQKTKSEKQKTKDERQKTERECDVNLSDLVGTAGVYPQVNENIAASAGAKARLMRDPDFKAYFTRLSRDNPDHKIIVRPSGTEDIIRVTVEGCDPAAAACIKNEIALEIRARLC
jgi:phosphoglucosamine mutase